MEELYVISKEDFEKYFKKERVIDKTIILLYYKKKIRDKGRRIPYIYHLANIIKGQ